MKRSKRYSAAKTAATVTPIALPAAIQAVKQHPVKFDAGVELHVRLGINPSKSDQLVRSTLSLPHGTGKTKRVAAFVPEDSIAAATAAGAVIAGGEELINTIKTTEKCEFDVAVAVPEMMKKLGPIAKILGQQGLMPNPKTETVGTDIAKLIAEHSAGKIAFRSDTGGNVHVLIGRVSFSDDQLKDNITAALDAIQKAKPDQSKGVYLQAITLASSMGPGIPVQL